MTTPVIDLTQNPHRLAAIVAVPWVQPGEAAVIVTGTLPDGRHVFTRVHRSVVDAVQGPAVPSPAPAPLVVKPVVSHPTPAAVRPPMQIGAPAMTTVTTPAPVRDRETVWREIETAAFAARRPGQTDPQAIDAFLQTDAGVRLYEAYRTAPAPARQTSTRSGLLTAPSGADAVFAQHRGLALASRRPGETDAAAIDRWYTENPRAFVAYRVALIRPRGD